MGTLRDAKNYGGIGAILILVGVFIPLVGIAVSIVGFILMVIAVKWISEAVGDRPIYDNMLYFVIIAIIGSVVAFLFVFVAFLPFLTVGGFPPVGDPIDITDPLAIFAILSVLIGLAIAWILSIVAAVFLRKSFNSISARLGVKLFGTSALLYLIGAILLIVIVGFFLIFVAEILMIIAFFSIPEQQAAPAIAQTPPAAP
ncbi:MAG: DUF996 domain-containing protein [Thermoplasmata archaeon]